MKYLFFIFTFVFLSVFSLLAQQNEMEAENRLREEVKQNFNFKLSTPLYADFSQTSINQYKNAYDDIKYKISELEKTRKLFKDLAAKNKNEVDNYIKLAYCDIAIISIYYEWSGLVLSIANITNDQELTDDWERGKNKYYNSAKRNLRKISVLKKDAIDIPIITAILSFFDEETPNKTALDDLLNIAEDLRQKVELIATDYYVDYDSYLGFVYSWIAYIYIDSNDYSKALKYLQLTQEIGLPEASAEWASITEEKLKDKRKKNIETEIVLVSKPNKSVSKTYYILNRVGVSEEFKKQNSTLIVNPRTLINKLINDWYQLSEIESGVWNSSWTAFNKSATSSSQMYPKSIYRDNAIFLINSKNKGLSSPNRLNTINYIRKINNLYSDLRYINDSWTVLIETNPKIPFYRFYRIKTNILLKYILQKKDYFNQTMRVLNYPSETIQIFNEFWTYDPDKEATEDINFLAKNYPNDVLYIVSNIEYNVFAKKSNNSLDYMTNIDETYKLLLESYLDFYNKNYSQLSGILGNLEGRQYSTWRHNIETWTEYSKLKDRIK